MTRLVDQGSCAAGARTCALKVPVFQSTRDNSTPPSSSARIFSTLPSRPFMKRSQGLPKSEKIQLRTEEASIRGRKYFGDPQAWPIEEQAGAPGTDLEDHRVAHAVLARARRQRPSGHRYYRLLMNARCGRLLGGRSIPGPLERPYPAHRTDCPSTLMFWFRTRIPNAAGLSGIDGVRRLALFLPSLCASVYDNLRRPSLGLRRLIVDEIVADGGAWSCDWPGAPHEGDCCLRGSLAINCSCNRRPTRRWAEPATSAGPAPSTGPAVSVAPRMPPCCLPPSCYAAPTASTSPRSA